MPGHRSLIVARSHVLGAVQALIQSHPECLRGNPEYLDLVEKFRVFEEARDEEVAGAHSGRDTSVAASTNLSAINTWRGKVQRRAFASGRATERFGRIVGGFTCDEMETHLRGSHQSISSAVNWCENAGWIRDTGHRRRTRSGAEAIVYEPTQTLIDKVSAWRRAG